MNINGFFALLVLAGIGFYFNLWIVTAIAFGGVVIGFAFMSKEAKIEKAPAVLTKPTFLNLPAEELETQWPTPDQMALSHLPDIATRNLPINPFESIPENARQMLPFPNYGKSNPIERLFFGVPIIGHIIWNTVLGKKS